MPYEDSFLHDLIDRIIAVREWGPDSRDVYNLGKRSGKNMLDTLAGMADAPGNMYEAYKQLGLPREQRSEWAPTEEFLDLIRNKEGKLREEEKKRSKEKASKDLTSLKEMQGGDYGVSPFANMTEEQKQEFLARAEAGTLPPPPSLSDIPEQIPVTGDIKQEPVSIEEAKAIEELSFEPDPVLSDVNTDVYVEEMPIEKIMRIRAQVAAAQGLGADKFNDPRVAEEFRRRNADWGAGQEDDVGPMPMRSAVSWAEATPETMARIAENERYFDPANVALRNAATRLEGMIDERDPYRTAMALAQVANLRKQIKKDEQMERILAAGRNPETGKLRPAAAATLIRGGYPVQAGEVERTKQETLMLMDSIRTEMVQHAQKINADPQARLTYGRGVLDAIAEVLDEINLKMSAVADGSYNPDKAYDEVLLKSMSVAENMMGNIPNQTSQTGQAGSQIQSIRRVP